MENTIPKQSTFRRLLLLLAITLYSVIHTLAQTVTIDNIEYYIYSTEAAVKGCSNYMLLPNEINIPNSIEYRNIPYPVTHINTSAFYNCTKITSVTIGNSVTSIGSKAFYGCTGLTSVNLGCSLTSIGDYAFYYCDGLTSVDIPDSVTTIGDYAFMYCFGLTHATIGSSVTSIGSYAFDNCTRLTSITIPNSVTTIGDYAFNGCKSATSLNIPDSVTSIGASAFSYCTGLTTIDIPDSVTTIGIRTFEGCTGLCAIDIPSSVIGIEDNAFFNCTELTDVTIGNKIKSIGYGAFSNCDKITCINSYNTTPPSCGIYVFTSKATQNATLYVSKESIEAYKAADTWKDFVNIKALQNGIPVSSLTLPESVSIEVGKTMTIEAEIAPEDATNRELTWQSSNETVAKVDSSGLVTAIAVGTATITASTTDDSDISTSVVVTVYDTDLTTNAMAPQDIEIQKGLPLEVSVEMNNTYNIIAFQTDIYLSEGIDFTSDDEGGTFIFNGNSSRFTSSHTISSARQKTGAVRVVAVSMSNKAFKKNSGELFTIPLQVLDGYTGPYTVELKNTIITDDSNKDHELLPAAATITVRPYTLGDVNDDGSFTVADATLAVNIILDLPDNNGDRVDEAADINADGRVTTSDVTSIVNIVLNKDGASAKVPTRVDSRSDNDASEEFTDRLYVNDVTVEPGVAKTVEMGIINEKTYIACQFDVYLPEGFEIETDDGDYVFDLDTSRKGRDHTVSSAAQKSGAVRAVIISMTNKAFKGNEGTLVSFPMIVPQDFSGVATARVSNVIFTDDNNRDNYLPEVEFKITSSDGGNQEGVSDISNNSVKIYSISSTIYVNNVAPAETVNIYNVSGSLIYTGIGDSKVSVIPGIYIVKVGSKVTKLAVK